MVSESDVLAQHLGALNGHRVLAGLRIKALRGQVGLKPRTETAIKAAIETPVMEATIAEPLVARAAIIEASIEAVVDKSTVETRAKTAVKAPVEAIVEGSPVGPGGVDCRVEAGRSIGRHLRGTGIVGLRIGLARDHATWHWRRGRQGSGLECGSDINLGIIGRLSRHRGRLLVLGSIVVQRVRSMVGVDLLDLLDGGIRVSVGDPQSCDNQDSYQARTLHRCCLLWMSLQYSTQLFPRYDMH